MICDMANAILHSNHWDPFELIAPNQPLVPPRALLDYDIPFREGVELIVNIPINLHGLHNLYIDNIIGLMINIPGTNHVAHGQVTALLAIKATARPNHPNEQVPQESMDARDKLFAKVGVTEIKMILGWEFDSWHLRISLP